MSQKNPNSAELPNLISLNEVWRRTGVPPYKIIMICNEIWLDCTPVDEGYRWQGQRLIPGNRDPLVPMTGKYKLTEDSQLELAERTIDPLRSRGFPLVANLTMETENGFLTLHSTSKSQCPPIPTPKILVPEKALEQFLAAHTQTYETAREASPEQKDRKAPERPIHRLLLRMMKSGINSGPELYKQFKREMVNKNRKYDLEKILLQWTDDEKQEFWWQNGPKAKRWCWKTVTNEALKLKNRYPELK